MLRMMFSMTMTRFFLMQKPGIICLSQLTQIDRTGSITPVIRIFSYLFIFYVAFLR